MLASLPFYPSYAANILCYQYNSLAKSNEIAQIFGDNRFICLDVLYLTVRMKVNFTQENASMIDLSHLIVEHMLNE
ncbi:unnamed protein product [Rotaria sp. Silwood1]|nr:unnamed protein product [Rotaria sp. Silwood1]